MSTRQSSDKLIESSELNTQGFNVVASGTITIPAADLSAGVTEVSSTVVYKYYDTGPGSGSPEVLLNDFDVFHVVQDPAHELPPDEDVDEIMIKLPHTWDGATAKAALAWRTFAGTPSGINVKLIIQYTPDAASSTPLSADADQTFKYFIYSRRP